MSVIEIYAGVEQADIAALTTEGEDGELVSFRCISWRSAANQVEAEIYTDGEDGQLVVMSVPEDNVVAIAIGDTVDCPRVLASGSSFFVHWIDSAQVGVLIISVIYRAQFDVTDPSAGWVNLGFTPIHESGLYDHATVIGNVNEQFIVSWRTGANDITTARYQAPWGWANTTWSQVSGLLLIDDRVVACHANEADNVVLISYQTTSSALRTIRRNASNGLGSSSANTMADVLDGDNQFVAVGHVRVAAGRYVVLAELAADDDLSAGRFYNRAVAWTQILSSDASQEYPSQWILNVHLLSRPWTWASGIPGFLECYVAISHKSITDGQEFSEMQGYIVRLDMLSLPNTDELSGVIRPIPVAALMDGTVDARPHGASPVSSVTDVSIGTRMNHLPHVTPPAAYVNGPDRKAVTFAICAWTRLVPSEDDGGFEVQPTGAAVKWVRFFHEEPWMLRRDEKEPEQPSLPQWRGANLRGVARPVETPAGLVFTGGITSIGDGERFVELGYLWGTEILAVDVTAMGGDNDEAGTYYWYANWYWQDRRGNIHRGPPSVPVSADMPVGGYATLRIRCLNLSRKDDIWRHPTAQRICVQIWRTTMPGGTPEIDDGLYIFRSEFGGGTVGWRLQDLPANDPDAFEISVIVGRSNDTLANNEIAPFQLDTQTLQWVPPPPRPHQPLTAATLWQNRLVGVSPDRPELIYSEPINTLGGTIYIVPEFLDTNLVELDQVGDVVAVVAQDFNASLLCRDAIFGLSGQPSTGGVGGDLDVQALVRGVGCVDSRSVVLTHLGAFFLAAKGMHLLDRGGGLQYLGGPVEELLARAGSLRGGLHLDGRHEVVWGLNDAPDAGPLEVRPRLLRYNYATNRWAVDVLPGFAQEAPSSRLNEVQGLAAWRARVGGEQLVVVLLQGGLALERSADDTVYGDEGAEGLVAIGLDLQSEWLMIADVCGAVRIKEIGIQTVRTHEGAMAVDVYYDEEGDFDETAPGETFPIDAPAPAYIRLLPMRERVTAIMVRVREVDPPATENVRLVKMLVVYAPKEKGRLVPPSAVGT